MTRMKWYLRINKNLYLVFFVIISYMLADLTILYIRPYMLAAPIKLGSPNPPVMTSSASYSKFQSIVNKNIFSLSGDVPDTLASLKSNDPAAGGSGKDNVPVPSTLPINLIGTLVHSNPQKSLANIEIKSKNLAIAVRAGNTIDTLAKLESVERGKIIIRNLNNNRLEYLELKEASKLSFSASKGASGEGDIKQVAPNKYEIKKSDVLKYTADLSNVLQQAAMVPARGPGGEILGFRFVNIQADSIYTKLGFQVGDMIKKVNGEPIDSPAKALELYGALKNNNKISITSDRDGREQTIDYDIK